MRCAASGKTLGSALGAQKRWVWEVRNEEVTILRSRGESLGRWEWCRQGESFVPSAPEPLRLIQLRIGVSGRWKG